MEYDDNYYKANAQDGDRPALWMYERIWQRYLGAGPVLEFGCGVGFFARRLAKHTRVFGLEVNPFALSQLQANAPQVQSIPSMTNLADESVGSVVALHVFEHIVDAELLLIGVELNRILRAGGRVLAVMPDLEGRAHSLKGTGWSAFSDRTHINLKGAADWKRLFLEYWKFDVITSFADGYYDFPYGRSFARAAPGDMLRAARTVAQFLLARPLLPQGDGENVVFVLEKRS